MLYTHRTQKTASAKIKRTFHPAFMLPPIKPADYSDLCYRMKSKRDFSKYVHLHMDPAEKSV